MDKFGCLVFIIFALYFLRSDWQNDQEKWNVETLFTEQNHQETALIETQHKVRLLNDGSQWLTKALDVNKDHDFNLVSTQIDPTGNKTHFFQQTYKGYPVENTFFQIASENGFIKSASGFHFPELDFRPIVTISEKMALENVLKSSATNVSFTESSFHSLIDPEAKLVITHDFQQRNYALCYKFHFTNAQEYSEPVFVDAESGNIIPTYEEAVVNSFEQLTSLIDLNTSIDENEGENFMDPTLENPRCFMPEKGLFANNTIVFSHENTIWDEEEEPVANTTENNKIELTANTCLKNDKLIGLGNNPFPSSDSEFVATYRFASVTNENSSDGFEDASFAIKNVNTEQFSKRLFAANSCSEEGIFVILVKQEAGNSVGKNVNNLLFHT